MDIRTVQTAAPAAIPTAEMVGALQTRSVQRESGAAFQSLLAVACDALAGLASPVRRAEDAALNLSQREHAQTVREQLQEALCALRSGLADTSRCLSAVRPSLPEALRGLLRPDRQRLADAAHAVRVATARPVETAPPDWFLATSSAVESLGEAAEHLDALAVAQPPDSAARELGTSIAAFLRRSRDLLLGDIARLVD
ncbi:MAG TPA: hypothetical protein EYQ24_08360 [Bacteroidetes bacterium]|nr:hypothetical protein [Bacteroidota bacterium]HIL57149.1 hypothetical protein [Rhodothermales bacterium]